MQGEEHLQLAVAPGTDPERIVSVPSRDMGKNGDDTNQFFYIDSDPQNLPCLPAAR